MGFDKSGKQVLPTNPGKNIKDFQEVAKKSTKNITLVDLCGHEKYLKTTIFGISGHYPNCAIVVIGANQGVLRMTKEHLSLCFSLMIPVIIVVTKTDLCPENVFKENMENLDKILKKSKRNGIVVTRDNFSVSYNAFNQKKAGNIPIFHTSIVTGVGLNSLKEFIAKFAHDDDISTKFENLSLKSMKKYTADISTKINTEYTIDNSYTVEGVGLVVGGFLTEGELYVTQKLWLGPDTLGNFRPVQIKSLQRLCINSERLYRGQHATISIKSLCRKEQLKKTNIRKGMVLVDCND